MKVRSEAHLGFLAKSHARLFLLLILRSILWKLSQAIDDHLLQTISNLLNNCIFGTKLRSVRKPDSNDKGMRTLLFASVKYQQTLAVQHPQEE